MWNCHCYVVCISVGLCMEHVLMEGITSSFLKYQDFGRTERFNLILTDFLSIQLRCTLDTYRIVNLFNILVLLILTD